MSIFTPKKIINPAEEKRLIQAIADAEMGTSGEIRVHVENKKVPEPYNHAVQTFEILGMTNTEARNGILIYINTINRQVVILGDKGIHEKVGDNFWKEEVSLLTKSIASGNTASGLIHCIETVGKKLAEFFPYQKDDKNELSNSISGLN